MSAFTKLFAVLSTFDARPEEKGATAAEYALLTAGIAVGLLVAVTAFGTALQTWFTGLGAAIGL